MQWRNSWMSAFQYTIHGQSVLLRTIGLALDVCHSRGEVVIMRPALMSQRFNFRMVFTVLVVEPLGIDVLRKASWQER
jgi:hypothetical protein